MADIPPQVGDPAPDIQLYTHDGTPWKLSEHRGHPVVLLFFPGAFTSVCTTELNTVNNDLDAYDGAEVVGISTNAHPVLDEFRSSQQFQFPLLSDHDAEVCAAYGAKYDQNFTEMNLDRVAKRAAFVVGPEGTIRYAEVLDDAGNVPDFDALKQVVNRL
jgi:peroxiredoxin